MKKQDWKAVYNGFLLGLAAPMFLFDSQGMHNAIVKTLGHRIYSTDEEALEDDLRRLSEDYKKIYHTAYADMPEIA